MLALERERAVSAWFRRTGDLHPYLTAVIRLTAADWLLENDRPGEAAALLRWHESVQFPAWRAARADATLQARVDSARSAWPISAEWGKERGRIRPIAVNISALDVYLDMDLLTKISERSRSCTYPVRRKPGSQSLPSSCLPCCSQPALSDGVTRG